MTIVKKETHRLTGLLKRGMPGFGHDAASVLFF